MNTLLSHCSVSTDRIILQKRRKDAASRHMCDGYSQGPSESSTMYFCYKIAPYASSPQVLFKTGTLLACGFVWISLMISILEQVAYATVFI